jgi:hypothetical protein
MSITRPRSGRSDGARRRPVTAPEILEGRQLLASGIGATYLSPWLPTDEFVTNPVTHQRELYLSTESVNPNNPNSPGLVNEGKVISGTDRAGDKWTITVHGPGYAIVTDTTPNDGELHDDINTIQLVGTSLKSTYVTGNVIASNTFPDIFGADGPNQPSNGEIYFNQLIALSGVKSIQLNGFDLTDEVTPAVTTTTGVFLYGGVGVLSFNSIIQQEDTSVTTTPYQIEIGEASTPLKSKPSIYLNNIQNLVYNGTNLSDPSDLPLTSSSVEFQINGVVRNFDIVSTGQGVTPSGFELYFTPVGTTGRTSLQATAVDNINVHGSAKNLTVSRAAVPFSSNSSGVNYLKKATFGGNADGVGLDVKGTIGKLTFKRGLGNPNGVATGTASNGLALPQTAYGTPQGSTGYPAAGFLGGQIRAKRIKKLTVRPANTLVQTAQDPDDIQLQGQGYPTYVTSPGYSITNGVITTSGSISQVSITGSQLNTEIKTGFDYTAYVNGLEPVRNASAIALKQKGDLINSPVSASFRAANNHYDRRTGTAGPGTITVAQDGKKYDTGGVTGLGNTGSGLFANRIVRVRKKR